MSETYEIHDMEREVGNSKDWLVGLRASIKKWEQIVAGDGESYYKTQRCGLCQVDNMYNAGCRHCRIVFPAIRRLCCNVDPDNMNPKRILTYLRRRHTQLKKVASE